MLDEICFWRADEESANPDKAVLAAIRPSMATFGDAGLLVAASSPYDKHGVLWEAHRRFFGVDDSSTLVWQAPTRVMNPTVPRSFIDHEIEQDPAGAESEYYATLRSDRDAFVNPDLVAEAVVSGRRELAPDPKTYRYFGFIDPSGGQQDAFALAVAHAEGKTLVLDCLREITPPLSPQSAVRELSAVLRSYGLGRVEGDAYSGQIIRELFQAEGVSYTVSRKSKSEIYLEFLPCLNSGRVQLLDNKKLVKQLCQLERRTGRGTGRDIVDHPKGSSYHDDSINAAAGSLCLAALAPAAMVFTVPFISERPRGFTSPGLPPIVADPGQFEDPVLAHGQEYAAAGDGLDAFRWRP